MMGQKKVIGQNFQSVSLDQVNDITFSSGLAFGVITIDTLKERFNVALDKAQAQNINNQIHDLLLKLKSKPEPAATSLNYDEIYKLKQLLDDGLITEEEFQKKKSDILNL